MFYSDTYRLIVAGVVVHLFVLWRILGTNFREMRKGICLNMLEPWRMQIHADPRSCPGEVHIEGDTEEQIEVATELVMPWLPRSSRQLPQLDTVMIVCFTEAVES